MKGILLNALVIRWNPAVMREASVTSFGRKLGGWEYKEYIPGKPILG